MTALFEPLPVIPQAACKGHDPRLWDDRLDGVNGDYESDEARNRRHRVAVAICAQCPVGQLCESLRGTSGGIWNGQLFETVNTPTFYRVVPCRRCLYPTVSWYRYRKYPQLREAHRERAPGNLCTVCHAKDRWHGGKA